MQIILHPSEISVFVKFGGGATSKVGFKPFLMLLFIFSEFDISAVVVYVGEAYLSGCQRKQWIFVTDGSECICNSLTEDEHDSLLAISFCSPILDNDSLAPINQCLSGNAVGFCNLIKRARDRTNHLWVAEATENSTYSISCNISRGSHLKGAADSALKWAKTSSMVGKQL
ncbi:hypothetical protein IEQ34_016958 [Dendrobium chrysotoxum]|uniref:Uncharacterized protein n=1 Tax=Dendrobium chrysotoxum TaxID=161865 RepID=A0AAV7GGN3_DENCH|nr:hypothetical protein IEQ34_016958 [Dendrobium chrysotoxum]